MGSYADQQLLDYVQRLIRTGTTRIDIPSELVEFASDEAIREMKALCQLSGVRISAIRATK